MTATQQKVSIRPLADRVVLQLIEENEYTSGGIIIPDSAREKPQQAEVIAVGPGARVDGQLIAMSVAVGNRVLFSKYAGTTIKLNNVEYMIVKESDILGIVE